MATDGAAARALDFVKKADKRLTSFSLFGGNKYEDAAELLEKAATQYKLAKCCEEFFFSGVEVFFFFFFFFFSVRSMMMMAGRSMDGWLFIENKRTKPRLK